MQRLSSQIILLNSACTTSYTCTCSFISLPPVANLCKNLKQHRGQWGHSDGTGSDVREDNANKKIPQEDASGAESSSEYSTKSPARAELPVQLL